jgi:glyoxalase-like protein
VSIAPAGRGAGPTGPVDPQLDHLVYAVPDLAAAEAEFAAATGTTPAPGGRHVGRGTRNALVGLGPTSYLEIIGPDPEQPADPGVAVPFGVDALTAPRLLTWAVHPADIAAAARASAAAGADLGPVAPMSRRTPAGDLLAWRLAAPHPAPFDGVTPFLIDWGATAHPAGAPGLPAVALRGLRATHPDPDGATAVLRALGLGLPVRAGPPGLVALLDTPRGPVVLS